MKTKLLLAILLIFNALINAQNITIFDAPDDFDVIDSIIYKEIDDKRLDLNFIKPANYQEEKSPLVIYFHGGGWGNGDKTKLFVQSNVEIARKLLAKNIAVSSVNYRLNVGGENTVKDLITDCKDAIRFWKINGDTYNIDTSRIALMGSSAGGHLCLMAGLGKDKDFTDESSYTGVSSDGIKCIVAHYPLTSFIDTGIHTVGNFANPRRFVSLLGGSFEDNKDMAALCSPVTYIDENNPPVLLIHGNIDSVLSVENSQFMYEKGVKAGSPVLFIEVKNAGHGFKGKNIQPDKPEIEQRSVDYYSKHLISIPQ